MNTTDPNLPLLESVAKYLGSLCEQLVFVGGCATGLLITETAAPPVRVTKDVDAIVEILTLTEYHALERQLESGGFRHDRSPDAPKCRWMVGSALLDVMPTDEAVLGFGNRWYDEAVHTAVRVTLPSGRNIRLISPPAFLGTKFEAFHGRGAGDFLASHDLEDIITVVDGRPELTTEIRQASPGFVNISSLKFGRYCKVSVSSKPYQLTCRATQRVKRVCPNCSADCAR
jgi:predicted nucleotidyltransferase